jgi:hypothetical protein
MNRSLLSLCLVNTLWHKYKKTYVDNFVPLMATTIIKHNYHKIENKDIKRLIDDFVTDFEIPLKYSPTLAILQKCKKNGILRLTGRSYYVNHAIANKFDLSKDIEENTYKQNKFLSEFKKFVNFEIEEDISDDIVSNLVLSFIENNDVGLFLFSGSTDGSLLPNAKLPHAYKRYRYLFDKFVSKIYNEDRDLFKILVEIALGSIATNALLFSFSSRTTESIKDSIIYLDTSIILRLIGVDERENCEAASCFLESIRSSGGILKIFTHTYEETIEVLETSTGWIESNNFDPAKANRATLFFRQEGYKKSDVELIISSLDRILNDNNIAVEDAPDYTFENVKINERSLQEIFENEILRRDKSFQKELYQRRTLRDISSICAISRLRSNIKYIRTIKEAKYVFVTLNGALSYANYSYNREFKRNKKWDIQECISDVFLGTYLWVSTPQIASTINSFKIKAVALSAIRPDPEMEQALQAEAKKLLEKGTITEDDYILVTTSHMIKDLLSDKHFGDAALINESSIYGILEEVKDRLLGKKDAEINSINQKYNEEQQKRQNAEIKASEEKNRLNNLIIKLSTKTDINARKKIKLWGIIIEIFFWMLTLAPILPAVIISTKLSIIFGILSAVAIRISAYGHTIQGIKEKINKKIVLHEKSRLGIEELDLDGDTLNAL